jgi:hypothetical protein
MELVEAGSAILFVVATLAQILLSFVVLSYAGHSFFTVVVNTAAGNDEVLWPREPLQDWLWKFWYFLWVLAVWLVPTTFVLGQFSTPLWKSTLVSIIVLWLIYPISLLSSLSATSRVVLLRPLIFRYLLAHPVFVIGFYLSTAAVLAACTALWYSALRTSFFWLIPMAAVLGAAGFLIYARLVGRLGWLVSHAASEAADDEEPLAEVSQLASSDPWATPDSESSPRPVRGRKRLPKTPSLVEDPWTAPPEKPAPQPVSGSEPEPDDPYGPATGTYGLLSDTEAPLTPPAPPPESPVTPDFEPFGLAPVEETPRPRRPHQPPALPSDTKKEERVAVRYDAPAPPTFPLASGIYTFVFYKATLGPMGTLALGFLGMGLLLRAQIALFPF